MIREKDGKATLTIRLDGAAGQTHVKLDWVGSSAVQGANYTIEGMNADNMVEFPSGTKDHQITITAIDDHVTSPDNTIMPELAVMRRPPKSRVPV